MECTRNVEYGIYEGTLMEHVCNLFAAQLNWFTFGYLFVNIQILRHSTAIC